MAYADPQKIIHLDMDAFYASVETRDDPRLANVPLIVGGKKGVVLTANYLARPFGIHSGMPSFQAKEKCPHITFVRPRYEAYKEASNQIHQVFRKYVDESKIESISLDEAYLDVSECDEYATKIAQKIRKEIFEQTRLTCSAGVSTNKMVAKIASDYQKPNAITVVQPHQITDFMRELPLRKIPGIGKVSEAKLSRKGFFICQDIWDVSLNQLIQIFGLRYAKWLFKRTRGIHRGKVGERRDIPRKSIGRERTIGNGVHGLDRLKAELKKLVDRVCDDLAKKSLIGRTITLKLKYDYKTRITRSKTLDQACNQKDAVLKVIYSLLEKTQAGQTSVRLIGLSVSNLSSV